jgi:transcription initiation factor TFIIIB Brf1 subunit/transcription initiation factor TFIIB
MNLWLVLRFSTSDALEHSVAFALQQLPRCLSDVSLMSQIADMKSAVPTTKHEETLLPRRTLKQRLDGWYHTRVSRERQSSHASQSGFVFTVRL